MYSYRFVDHPVPVNRQAYDRAVSRMCDRVATLPGVRSIFQIGSVSTPGISDLDIVVVFEEGAVCRDNPLGDLDGAEKYLFIHRLYGAPHHLFRKARPITFYHSYRLLHGEPVEEDTPAPDDSVRTQTALEYVLKMYVNAAVSRVLRVVKLRGLFLHVKALRYDLELLGATSEPLGEVTDRLIEHRARWFEGVGKSLAHDLNEFYFTLEDFLRRKIAEHGFHLPSASEHPLARSITLRPGKRLAYRHYGIVLPRLLSGFGRTYYRLQHRLGRFQFELPAVTERHPGTLARRFELLQEITDYNRRCLPHFAPLTTSLNL